MDRNLLGKFLDRGIMISPDIANEITEEDYQRLESSGKETTVLDKNILVELRKHNIGGPLIVRETVYRKEISTKDFLNYYRKKLQLLPPFITKKMIEKPTSINKTRENQENSILGFVRSIVEKRFTLEDFTGIVAKHDPKKLVKIPWLHPEPQPSNFWDAGPYHKYGITNWLVEGGGGQLNKRQCLDAGAILMKSITEYYAGQKKIS